MIFTTIGAALPIGEHLYLGDPNSIWNIHLDTVGLTLVAAGILVVVGLIIRSTVTSGPPSRLQNGIEAVMQFLNAIIEENLGREPGAIASIALTLFFFIWVANMIGLLPIPKVHSPTSDINATFALALLVFILLHARFIRTSGLSAYKGHYWTKNPFLGIVLNPASVLLGLVNELSRPLTLSFRLFGNILAGEVLLVVWAFLLPANVGFGVTALWNAIFVAYGVFVGTIQAFIFTVLTVAYMAIASEPVSEH
ncbi:MAG TPA: F0F1 ATP synthase subunit A [Chloroflexota bacterium]|nr:F0F1 ATP synthase subunit A [Chloroflexota bacterium]